MLWLGTVTAASGAYNNLQTGHSGIGTFTVPPGVKALYLHPSVSGLQFEIFAATGATNTTAARGAYLNGNVSNGPFRVPNCYSGGIVVAIYNSAGSFQSVRVYKTETS